MKLTESTLRDMVREILKEDEMPFPPPPDEQTVESTEDSLDNDQDIIRFYENDEKDDENHLDVHSNEKDDLEGLAARAMAAVHDLATRAGADISTTVDTGEEEIEEGCSAAADEDVIMGEEDVQESLSLDGVVQEEISKYIKKKT